MNQVKLLKENFATYYLSETALLEVIKGILTLLFLLMTIESLQNFTVYIMLLSGGKGNYYHFWEFELWLLIARKWIYAPMLCIIYSVAKCLLKWVENYFQCTMLLGTCVFLKNTSLILITQWNREIGYSDIFSQVLQDAQSCVNGIEISWCGLYSKLFLVLHLQLSSEIQYWKDKWLKKMFLLRFSIYMYFTLYLQKKIEFKNFHWNVIVFLYY